MAGEAAGAGKGLKQIRTGGKKGRKVLRMMGINEQEKKKKNSTWRLTADNIHKVNDEERSY